MKKIFANMIGVTQEQITGIILVKEKNQIDLVYEVAFYRLSQPGTRRITLSEVLDFIGNEIMK